MVTHPLDLKLISITGLTDKKTVKGFDCGNAEIDRWVNAKATRFVEQSRAKVFIATTQANTIAKGLYTISFLQENPGKLIVQRDRDIWNNGVPLVYLGYLAVQANFQKCGLGTFLLSDFLDRSYHIHKHIAFYGVALRSLNERTTKLYASFGFSFAKGEEEERSPLMILPIWTLIDLIEGKTS